MQLDVSPSSTPEPRGSSAVRASSDSGDLSPQFVSRNRPHSFLSEVNLVSSAQAPDSSESSRSSVRSRLVSSTKAVLIVGAATVGSLVPSVALG